MSFRRTPRTLRLAPVIGAHLGARVAAMPKIRLTVAYNQPPDPEVFYDHYEKVHVGLAKNIPGLESFEWSKVVATATGEAPRYALLAELTFPSMDDFGAGLGSEAGQAAANDVGAFAANGADMFISELAD
ncbi:MAG: hypothetical protein QOG39_4 [Acidimicrobiaceae bacterium]